MNKIWLIIQREYLTRVKKKSFIIMTILGPILMAAVMVLPVYLSSKSDKVYNLYVVDDWGIFTDKIKESRSLTFDYLEGKGNSYKEQVRNQLKNDDDIHDGVLHIMAESPTKVQAYIYYNDQLGLSNQEYIRSELQNIMDNYVLESRYNITKDSLETHKVKVQVGLMDNHTSDEGRIVEISIIALAFGIIIYFFIFMYGSQVLRGVIEEKTNRIIEIIVSSVKPFQLMMGKIIGVALVGLTQFLLWIVFTGALVSVVAIAFPESFSPDNMIQEQFQGPGTGLQEGQNLAINQDTNQMLEMVNGFLGRIDIVGILLTFVFYFLFGYLMYSAMFASIGSAVDSEADTQQFMLPVTIPMLLGIMMSSFILNNPNGPVAFWLSIIPFTSPIVMMIRVPFGVPAWELALSMTLLVGGFVFMTWLAGKIYRTGILMYGKKASYAEIWKWIRYRS